MSATCNIIWFTQILKLVSLTETSTTNYLSVERLLVDVNSIIYQSYRHLFSQWERRINVLDEICKFIHTS